jgi:hypothetical protein
MVNGYIKLFVMTDEILRGKNANSGLNKPNQQIT